MTQWRPPPARVGSGTQNRCASHPPDGLLGEKSSFSSCKRRHLLTCERPSRARAVLALRLALADVAQLAELGAAAGLTGFVIVLALAKLFRDAAPLQQFLEAAQGGANRLAIVNTHS